VDHAVIELTIFERLEVSEGDFDLVDEERFFEVGIEEIDHAGAEVANAEVFDNIAIFEDLECFGDFDRIHEDIGSMELVEIDGFNLKAIA